MRGDSPPPWILYCETGGGGFTNSDGASDQWQTVREWTNNMGQWSVAWSDGPLLLVKHPPESWIIWTNLLSFNDLMEVNWRNLHDSRTVSASRPGHARNIPLHVKHLFFINNSQRSKASGAKSHGSQSTHEKIMFWVKGGWEFSTVLISPLYIPPRLSPSINTSPSSIDWCCLCLPVT